MRYYMTKDKNGIAAGQKKMADFTFTAATADEIKKALGDGVDVPEGYVAGWASTADIDSYGHKVVAGAFAEAIQKRGLRGPKSIKLLIGHNWQQLAGEIKVLEYRGTRLWIEAQMALNITYVRDAYEAAKMLGGTNFSVGFMLQDYSWKETEAGKEFLQIDRGDLFEVSIVPFPGNEEATMTFIKSAKDGDPDDDTGEEDETLPTVSEFEKALVRSDLVKSRNQAREITKLVKANLLLFTPKEEPVSTKGHDKHPVLDVNKLTELSSLMAKMKAVIAAPVATK